MDSKNVRIIEKAQRKGEKSMIAIGADHGGYRLKEQIKEHYQKEGSQIKLKDYGTFNEERGLEEPKVALAVAEAVADGTCEAGILICRSGVGMTITANKVKGVRCALAYNEVVARSIKEHNNANVVAIGADYTTLEEAIRLIEIWKNASFLEGIYAERLQIVSDYESKKE